MGKIYAGNNKVEIILDLGIDVTGATIVFSVLKPNQSVPVSWTALPYTMNDLTTYARYTALSTDLDVPGVYSIQPFVTLSDGSFSGKTDTYAFRVYDSFK